MDAVTLLSEAKEAGLTVEAHNGDLRVRGPRTAAAMVERLRAHKGELLAALAAGGAAAPVGERLNRRNVEVLNEGLPVGIGLGNEDLRPHEGNRVGVAHNVRLPAGGDQPERVERVPVHQFSDGLLSAHTHSVHHDGAALQHADRETARFLRVAIPDADGMGWHDPGTRAPVAPTMPTGPAVGWLCDEQAERLPPDVGALVTARDGWTPGQWVARLRHLADACADMRPDLAERYTQAADRMTGQGVEGVESIGAIIRRVREEILPTAENPT